MDLQRLCILESAYCNFYQICVTLFSAGLVFQSMEASLSSIFLGFLLQLFLNSQQELTHVYFDGPWNASLKCRNLSTSSSLPSMSLNLKQWKLSEQSSHSLSTQSVRAFLTWIPMTVLLTTSLGSIPRPRVQSCISHSEASSRFRVNRWMK